MSVSLGLNVGSNFWLHLTMGALGGGVFLPACVSVVTSSVCY